MSIPKEIQLSELEQIAHTGHMDYLILGALLKTDLPEEDKERLRPFVIRSTMKTLQQVCCIRELEKRLEEMGISHQILKGSVMKFIYPAPELREMSDIDVVIYGENLDRVKGILTDMGFGLKESVKHHDVYQKYPFLIVEAHWALYDKQVDKKQFEYFQDYSSTPLKEGSSYAREFTKEQFYVYMIAHMAKHFYENGCGIRNLLDIYIYNEAYGTSMDRAIVRSELETCGLVRFEERMASLAVKWMTGAEITQKEEILFHYMLDCGIYGKGENGIWGQIAKNGGDMPEQSEKYMKRWYYFPPLSYMTEYYPWLEKHEWLLPVAWIMRGFHGLGNRQGKEKRKMLLEIQQNELHTMKEMYEDLELDFSKK